MAKEQHTHKLKRHVYKTGNAVYFCALPECAFKINAALAVGKRTVCWRCGDLFIMSEYSIRLAKPHCEKCHRPKKELLNIDEINEEIKEFIPEQPGEAKTTISDLRSRLTSTLNKGLLAIPDDEGDI